METTKTYICKSTFSWFTKGGKKFYFQKDMRYNFFEANEEFIYIDNKNCIIDKENFNESFLSAESLENKWLSEDSRNIIKEETWYEKQEKEISEYWIEKLKKLKIDINYCHPLDKNKEIAENFQKESEEIFSKTENLIGNKLEYQSDLELDFDMEVQSTLQKIQQLLLVKGKEYRRNSDPFHNFNIGSQISGEIPEKVLQGFLLKHLVSYQDMLNDIEQGKLPKIELVEEKMNDIITYFVIQKAQIINRIKKS